MSYTIPATTTLDYQVLTRCWQAWVDNYEISDGVYRRWLRDCYTSRLSLPSHNHCVKKFQDWLWQQGGTVVKRQGKQCIEFADADRALIFALRWS